MIKLKNRPMFIIGSILFLVGITLTLFGRPIHSLTALGGLMGGISVAFLILAIGE